MDRPTKITPVGRRLRNAREDRGWKMSELARRSGVDASFISRVESGEIAAPSGERLGILAQTLGISVDALVHGHSTEMADTSELRQLVASTLGPDNAALVETVVKLLAEKPSRDRDVVLRVIIDLIKTFPSLSPDRTN